MTRAQIPKRSRHRPAAPGAVVHSDLCGPMRTQSIQGSFYMVAYVDGRSSWTYVEGMKQKSEQITKFKEYEAIMKRQFDVEVKILRSDGGGEYSSAEFQTYLKGQGIMWQHSAPRTPQQNGKAERANRTIMEMGRCLLLEAGLAHRYWEYAVLMAAYIRNRTPTKANPSQMSPYEVLHGKVPDLSGMHNSVHTIWCTFRMKREGNWTRKQGRAYFWDSQTARRPVFSRMLSRRSGSYPGTE
jgi:hypothetical protein